MRDANTDFYTMTGSAGGLLNAPDDQSGGRARILELDRFGEIVARAVPEVLVRRSSLCPAWLGLACRAGTKATHIICAGTRPAQNVSSR